MTDPELGSPVVAQEPPQWQLIETAPKDMDVLLLYQDGEGVQPGYWYDSGGQQCWLAVETQGLTGGKMQPTHWMPLPLAPLAREGPPHEENAEEKEREEFDARSRSAS